MAVARRRLVSWTVVVEGHLFTLNGERTMHYHKRAKLVKTWREAAFEAAQKARVPKMNQIDIVCQPCRGTRRNMADTGGHFPVAKACIDGLVDAGVIPDDGPEFVRSLTFRSPYIEKGTEDRMILIINEVGKS
jgi:hypothetical protein